MRLDRLLTNLGIGSRTECQRLIKAGHIRVEGAVCKDGSCQVSETDKVEKDFKQLDIRLTRHVMMHKPAGILTAADDHKQKTVMDLLPVLYRACGCMPIGRLDKDTTGLLLLTTDGELAHRLISPAHHVDKIYIAEVDGVLDETDVRRFAEGIQLKDFTAMPAVLEILSPSTAKITVQEGKYHQVKRMMGALGKPVLQLRRISFGSLQLDADLKMGAFRELTEQEAAALYEAAGMAK